MGGGLGTVLCTSCIQSGEFSAVSCVPSLAHSARAPVLQIHVSVGTRQARPDHLQTTQSVPVQVVFTERFRLRFLANHARARHGAIDSFHERNNLV